MTDPDGKRPTGDRRGSGSTMTRFDALNGFSVDKQRTLERFVAAIEGVRMPVVKS